MQKHLKPLLLSGLTGVLLCLGWPVAGYAPFLFIAWIPLLFVEDKVFTRCEIYRPVNLFSYAYFSFFTWNVLTTWWVKNASWGGAAMAILANSLLMALVFLFFHLVKKRPGRNVGYLIFPAFWISFEFLHLDWDLSYPWLTLGNGLAEQITWIQWYEYTGVFGGSLWILSINILLFHLFKNWNNQSGKRIINMTFIIILISVPIFISHLIYKNYKAKGIEKNVVVVQPNIDPYNEKFTGSYREQLNKILGLSLTRLDSSADYLVFPETALTEDMWENTIEETSSINLLQDFVKRYPKLNIITGAATYKGYDEGSQSVTARKFKQQEGYYDAFNTALQVDNSGEIQIYHKSKLVPGVEKMPFPMIFKPLEKLAINLGGTIGSLGTQEERTPLKSADDSTLKVAAVICYESIYGEYVTDYIKNGAKAIFIITNDGWWGDTPGYKQHLVYGTLRAIETRKDIVRSANTGISCFIDQRGNIHQPLKWWIPGAISAKVKFNDEHTFYIKHGDYIARACLIFSALVIILFFSLKFFKPKNIEK